VVVFFGVSMSTMGGGGGSPEFEKLIQLATFVQGEGYLQRVKELRDLEASSKKAVSDAAESVAVAARRHEALDKREAALLQREAALAAEKGMHDNRVHALTDALAKARR
jgi:hypothetical protein